MANQWFFVAKLFVLSGLISVAIKYLGPLLNIPATPEVALGFVLTPPILLGLMLAGRQADSQQSE